MEKLKMPYNCSSVDFEQRDKINEIINEIENIDLDLKALFKFKENILKQQIYKTPDNVKDYINRCDDAILKTNVNIDDIAIAEVKHEKQSKLDEAMNQINQTWVIDDVHNITWHREKEKEIWKQALQEKEEESKLWQTRYNDVNNEIQELLKINKQLKNQKIKVDEDIINEIKTGIEDFDKANKNDPATCYHIELGITNAKRLLSIIDKKEE